jgi:hypothetical protein
MLVSMPSGARHIKKEGRERKKNYQIIHRSMAWDN